MTPLATRLSCLKRENDANFTLNHALSMRLSSHFCLKKRMDSAWSTCDFALFLAIFAAASAHADDERLLARSLLNWLSSPAHAATGAAYIYGVVDTIKAQRQAAKQADVICLPANMEEAQLADIVRRFLLAQPQRLQAPASAMVVEALSAALPCPAR
jgi:Rap1a immunity proteins